MEFNSKYYDNTDQEKGVQWHEWDKAIRKEMKKQEKPKTKPAEVFEGFKDTKTTKKNAKRGNKYFSYSKEDTKKDYRK
jgi:hypothetical protein